MDADILPEGPLVAWYGDDFTGAAATMEVLAFAGLDSVLFTDVPTAEQLARFPQARGIGIASTARSHPPEWMHRHLPDAFRALAATGASILHYKVCSTLDSAPHVGSIGCALDIATNMLDIPWVPVLIAAPEMRRYQAFGHLFAAAPDGVHRLDRHPVMSRHPVTPIGDSDVARHLSAQTAQPIGCLTLEDLQTNPDQARDAALAKGTRILTLDTVTAQDQSTCGALIWSADKPVFCIGSQGVEYALVRHWRDTGLLRDPKSVPSAGLADKIVVVSGSVSPVTAAQIAWAEANGFAVLPLDATAIAGGDLEAEEATIAAAHAALAAGKDPLVCTARGPDDPAVRTYRATLAESGLAEHQANARIGAALGRILARLLRETDIRRAVISGGDTSGHATQQLGLYAFTALAPTIPGAALLTAHAADPALDGLQIALKGGQMGSPDYFGWIKHGGGPRPASLTPPQQETQG